LQAEGAVAEEAEAVDETHSKKKFWLGITSKYKPTSPSSTPQRV
jgi:hypothetical protein